MAGRKKAPLQLLSTAEFAQLMGVSRQAVLKAINEGRIDAEKDGGNYKINPLIAKKQFLESKERQVANDPNGDAGSMQNISNLKRIRLGIQIQQDQLNLQKAKGELVSVKEVNDKLFKMGMEIRQQFQMLPNQVIDDILSAASRTEAHRLLSEALDRELLKLSSLEI
jgi:excisionase family DNA binding protein